MFIISHVNNCMFIFASDVEKYNLGNCNGNIISFIGDWDANSKSYVLFKNNKILYFILFNLLF